MADFGNTSVLLPSYQRESEADEAVTRTLCTRPSTWPIYSNIVNRTRPYMSLEKAWRDIDPAIENTDFQQSDDSEEEEGAGRSRRKHKPRQVYSPQEQQRRKQGVSQDNNNSIVSVQQVALSQAPEVPLHGFSNGSFSSNEQFRGYSQTGNEAVQYAGSYPNTSPVGAYQNLNPQHVNHVQPQINNQPGATSSFFAQQRSGALQSVDMTHMDFRKRPNIIPVFGENNNDPIFGNQQTNANGNGLTETNGNQHQDSSQFPHQALPLQFLASLPIPQSTTLSNQRIDNNLYSVPAHSSSQSQENNNLAVVPRRGTSTIPNISSELADHQNPPRTGSASLKRMCATPNGSIPARPSNAPVHSLHNVSNSVLSEGTGGPLVHVTPRLPTQSSPPFVERSGELGSVGGNAVTDEILERVKAQSRLIDFLLQSSASRVITPRSRDLDEVLPLNTMAKYLDFEQSLERLECRNSLTSVIQSIGGKSINDVIVRTMEEIFRDCVAKDINWEGELRKGVQKQSFGKSKIKAVMFDALKSVFDGTTFYDMEVCVKNWLRHAPGRYKASLNSTRTPRRRRRR